MGRNKVEAEGGKEVGAEKNYHVSSATPPSPTYQVVVKAPLFPPIVELTPSYHNLEQFLQLETHKVDIHLFPLSPGYFQSVAHQEKRCGNYNQHNSKYHERK